MFQGREHTKYARLAALWWRHLDRVHFGGRGKHGDFSGQTVGSNEAHSLALAARSHSLQYSTGRYLGSQVL